MEPGVSSNRYKRDLDGRMGRKFFVISKLEHSVVSAVVGVTLVCKQGFQRLQGEGACLLTIEFVLKSFS